MGLAVFQMFDLCSSGSQFAHVLLSSTLFSIQEPISSSYEVITVGFWALSEVKSHTDALLQR